MRLPKHIQDMLKSNNFKYSKHFRDRQVQRHLKNIDVKTSLLKGIVVEMLYRYGIGQKYVVCCKFDKKVFHIVLIYKNDLLLLKTIYKPDSRHFQSDNMTRLDRDL